MTTEALALAQIQLDALGQQIVAIDRDIRAKYAKKDRIKARMAEITKDCDLAAGDGWKIIKSRPNRATVLSPSQRRKARRSAFEVQPA